MNQDKKNIIYYNGNFISNESSVVDILSQTIHYGFGAFEGIRAYQTNNGVKIFKAREHFDRLQLSCNKVNIPFTWEVNDLIEASYKLLEINQLKDAYIRPLVSCGLGMNLTSASTSEITIMAWEWDMYAGDKLLKTCISSFERPNPKSTPINVKITGNYVSSILATTEAKNKGFDEAIQLDISGNLAEAPGANIFIEKKGKLFTPPATENILPGITRANIIKIAKQLEIDLEEKTLTVADLKNADSAFLCSTAAEVIGIISVDDVYFRTPFAETSGAIIQRAYKNLVLDKLSFEVII